MKNTKKAVLAVVAVIALVAILSVSLVACNKPDANKNTILFGKELITYEKQLDVLTEMKKGSIDLGVIDSLMANWYASQGDFKEDIAVVPNVTLATEAYGIGAKKGNKALVQKLNQGMIDLAKSGRITEIAAKYGLTDYVMVKNDSVNPIKDSDIKSTDTSWADVKKAKKIIIGCTFFAPIAFSDNAKAEAPDQGFDVDVAKAVFEEVFAADDILVEFTVIDWSLKEAQLNNGTIDLAWNGMTITEERQNNMEISMPYLENQQCVICPKAKLANYSEAGSVSIYNFIKNSQGAIVGVENGSAGKDVMEKKN